MSKKGYSRPGFFVGTIMMIKGIRGGIAIQDF